MLEFIVLGQVPGTHTQVTFGWVLGLLFAIFGMALVIFDIIRLKNSMLRKLQLLLTLALLVSRKRAQ